MIISHFFCLSVCFDQSIIFQSSDLLTIHIFEIDKYRMSQKSVGDQTYVFFSNVKECIFLLKS